MYLQQKTFVFNSLAAIAVSGFWLSFNFSGTGALLIGIGSLLVGLGFLLLGLRGKQSKPLRRLDERELELMNMAYRISGKLVELGCIIAFVVTFFADWQLSLKLVMSVLLTYSGLSIAFTKLIIVKKYDLFEE